MFCSLFMVGKKAHYIVLDFGYVCQIPGCPGVSRTVTGLVFMILDLHLRLPHLKRKLMWFNDNSFILFFSFQMMEHQKLVS